MLFKLREDVKELKKQYKRLDYLDDYKILFRNDEQIGELLADVEDLQNNFTELSNAMFVLTHVLVDKGFLIEVLDEAHDLKTIDNNLNTRKYKVNRKKWNAAIANGHLGIQFAMAAGNLQCLRLPSFLLDTKSWKTNCCQARATKASAFRVVENPRQYRYA